MNADSLVLLYFCVLLVLTVLLYCRGGCTAVSFQAVAASLLSVVILLLIRAAQVLGVPPQGSGEEQFIRDMRLYAVYISSHILIVKNILQSVRQAISGRIT